MGKRVAEHKAALAMLLAVVLAPALLAGGPKEVVATWAELPPLVEKRDIEAVLLNGVHIRGRVEKVLPEALEVRVKRTSDPNVVPKGRTRVPRELLSEATVQWRQGSARFLLPAVFPIGIGYYVLAQGVDLEREGSGAILAIWSVGAVIGYLVGSRIDQRRLRIRIDPDRISPSRGENEQDSSLLPRETPYVVDKSSM
ncbi:MAG: hypothetical protein RMK57_11085 [Bryobacterales bacterium]|nr:hypothetical protein [Bryobacteraceae bacterium]MDW8355063.1 hypothetical protein [Bryobacterales bacterium]